MIIKVYYSGKFGEFIKPRWTYYLLYPLWKFTKIGRSLHSNHWLRVWHSSMCHTHLHNKYGKKI